MRLDQILLQRTVELENRLNQELSVAIAKVLENHGITGQYLFSIQRDYREKEPLKMLGGEVLQIPNWCYGTGLADVREPRKIIPI